MFSSPRFSLLIAALTAAMLSVSAAQAQTAVASSPVVVSGPAGQITQEDVEIAVRDLVPPEQQAGFWVNAGTVGRFARNLYTQRALAAQAEQAGLDKSPQAQAYLRQVRERALTALLMEERGKTAPFDEKALESLARSEYLARPERFAQPEEVHARHILLSPDKDGSDDAQVKTKADALLDELRKGADFAKLAQENSSDKGSAQQGGDLGFFPRGKMVPAFEEAAFDLKKPGDLAGPVKTQFGYHIIELMERKPAGTKKFEDVLPDLKKEMAAKLASQTRKQLWDAADAPAQVDNAAATALAERQVQQVERQKP